METFIVTVQTKELFKIINKSAKGYQNSEGLVMQ